MNKENLAVIGLGLIGGSILKRLKNNNYNLIGVSRRQETIDKAVKEGIISRGSTKISVIKDADIVFICTPINTTISILNEAAETVNPKTIITDTASLKGFIIDFVNTNSKPINFIGGHPMAGTENKGLDASFPGLFEEAKWVLTPSKWTNDNDVKKLEKIIHQLGAKTVSADPHKHDKAVALISHMPLFLSQTLFNLVKNYPDKSIGDLAMNLASSGFRDMTRLAATNPELTADMLFENKENVFSDFEEFINESAFLGKNLIENKDNFIKISREIANLREKMYSAEGKNIYTEE